MPPPLVSVCIITYQHARFIAKSIEGALMQKTSFPVEIVIGEDDSSDGTREICQDYAKRHADRIRLLLRQRRDVTLVDGLPSGGGNLLMTFREARGEFIAVCEGDDYWTDPEKLQRQVDYLRTNPDCSGCFHDTQLVDADGRVLAQSYFQSNQDKFTQQDVLESLLSREPTCSLLFRKSALSEPLPEWYVNRTSDLYLDILLTNHGSLGFVRRNMGAYRKHAGGIWSCKREATQLVELIFRYKLLLADPTILGKYQNILLRKIDELQAALFTREDAAGEVKRLEAILQEQLQALQTTGAECARLKAEARAAQQYIDGLRTQLDQLAAISRQQTEHLAVLERERDRLAALEATHARDIEHYVKVITEQTNYIGALEQQRSQHAAKNAGA